MNRNLIYAMDMYFCLNINNFLNANKFENTVKLNKVLLICIIKLEFFI